MAGRACKVCGGDPGLFTGCEPCEGTGFEREETRGPLELLKDRLAYDGAAVLVSHDNLTAAIAEIERLREDAATDGKYMEQLTDEIIRIRGWHDASQDALGEVLTELRKQTEMLERIRREQVRGE